MAQEINIEVITHSGREHILKAESYDIEDLHEKTNDSSIQTIRIGDKLFSRVDIKYIGPYEENTD